MKRKLADIQSLYDYADYMKRKEIQSAEERFQKRLKYLDSNVNNLTIETINNLLIEWEKTEFDSTIDELFNTGFNEKKEEVIKIDFQRINHDIKNQFNKCYYIGDAKKYGAHGACVTISLIFCYFHLNTKIVDSQLIKNSISQGAVLYNEWKINTSNNLHPTLLEILNLDICKPFRNTYFERGGLFKIIDEDFEKEELTGQRPTFKQLLLELLPMFNKDVPKICLILGIKVHYFFSIVIINPGRPMIGLDALRVKCDILLFDSHGTINENIDYIKIGDCNSLISYLSKTYEIMPIMNFQHQQSEGKKMNEFDIYCKYGFTGFVFV